MKQERAQLIQEVAQVKLDKDELVRVRATTLAKQNTCFVFTHFEFMQIVAAMKKFLECSICLQYMDKPVT